MSVKGGNEAGCYWPTWCPDDPSDMDQACCPMIIRGGRVVVRRLGLAVDLYRRDLLDATAGSDAGIDVVSLNMRPSLPSRPRSKTPKEVADRIVTRIALRLRAER